MIFIDANIFLRFFLKENELVSRDLEKIFNRIISGNIICISNTIIIAEVIWVLDRFYKWNKEKICDNVELILNTPNIRFRERPMIIEAINLYREENINFIDAYNYFFMKANGINEIYSFDKDFDKLPDIKRLEP